MVEEDREEWALGVALIHSGNQEIIREDCVGGNVKRYAPTQERPAELGTELWTALSEQGTDQLMKEVWTWRHVSRPRARSREQLMGTDGAQECYRSRRLMGKTLEGESVHSKQGTDQLMREVWKWRHVSRPRARSCEQLMGTGGAQECYRSQRLLGKTLEVAWERAFIQSRGQTS